MKRIVLLVFGTFMLTTHAQDINIGIKKSEIIKEESKKISLLFSEPDGNGGVVIIKALYTGFRGYPKKYFIEHYDQNLKRIKKIELPNTNKSVYNGILIKNNKIHLIEQIFNKASKEIKYNVQVADVNDFKFKTKELFTINRESYKRYFAGFIGFIPFDNGLSQMDKDHFGEVTISNNNNYMAFSFDIKNKEKESHLFKVYDTDFNLIYDTTFHSDIKDKYFEYESVDIDDKDGAIYLLGKVFENNSKKSKKKGKSNYHYQLSKLNKEGKKQISFKESEKFIGSLHVLHRENTLSLVGFYSEKGDYRYKGVCRLNLNSANLSIENKSFNPFSDQFFNDKYSKGTKVRKGKKELKNLSFRSVYLDENENVIINAEEYYITSYYVSSGTTGGGYWRTVYHWDDIISVKMNKNGDLLWARNINKAQTNYKNASFISTINNNKVYFFLNISDKIKKLSNERIGFKQTSTKKSNLYVIEIDENGEFKYQKLIDDKDSKVWYDVSSANLSSDLNSIIIQGSKKKYKRILKLTL